MRIEACWFLTIALTACGCGRTGSPPVAFVAGQGQSAPAGTPLAVDPAVRVLDAAGRPAPGVAVTFTVAGGNGAVVLPGEASTDPEGIARARLTLGTATGTYTLEADVSGVGAATLAATAVPGPAATVTKLEGDLQVGAPGAPLGVAPRVRVQDGFGNAAAGATVGCDVEAGGGSVPAPVVTAGADGIASCGTWTLGSGRGENVLRVLAGAAPGQRFHAAAGVTSGEMAIAIIAGNGGPPPDFPRQYLVYATKGLPSTVTLRMGGLTLEMARGDFQRFGPNWNDSLPERDLTGGLYLVCATGVSSTGDEADAFAWVEVDHLPVVEVLEPADDSLARPTIRVRATCADDDPAGCARLEVSVNVGGTLASGSSPLDVNVDLSQYEGSDVFLEVRGTDSAGGATVVSRRVFVDSSPRLALVGTVSGDVLDTDGARALHWSGGGQVAVTDLVAGETTAITEGRAFPPSPGVPWPFARLTPQGALFLDYDGTIRPQPLLEWRGAGLAARIADVTVTRVGQAGGWALYETSAGLVRRELSSGTEVVVAPADALASGEVAANGDVAFASAASGDVSRYRDGTVTPITSDGTAILDRAPVTDGVRVVWNKAGSLAVWDGAEAVGGPVGCSFQFLAGPQGICFLVAGPWIALQRPEDPTGSFPPVHVLRLGPDGEVPLDTAPFGGLLEILEPDGTVVFRNLTTLPLPGRWRVSPGGPLVGVGTGLGTAVSRGGKEYVLLGRSVLEVVP